MLLIDSLVMTYDTRTIWSDVGLSVASGRMVAIVGHSGSGKSTLLNCIGLLESPTSGSIVFDDLELVGMSSRKQRRFRRDSLGYLFQNYGLIEDATVRENLALASPGTVVPNRRQTQVIADALGQVGLEDRVGAKVASLSGGEQQRVAIARLLMKTPSLVLADEPTGALDSDNAAEVIRLLRGFADGGCTVLVATHNSSVSDACDQVVNIEEYVPGYTVDSSCVASSGRT